MPTAAVTVEFDHIKRTVAFRIDLQGHTPYEHELLAAAFDSVRSVSLKPTHDGDQLSAAFIITDPSIWPKALHALENRKRVANGKPTIEQEEAQIAAAKAAEELAQKAAKK